MKVFEKSICLAMILAVLFSFTGFAAQCEDIPEHVLRLHVLANSDSQEDQTLKLQVRDRILQESAGMLDGVRNKEEAEQRIRETLPALQRAAEDEIEQRGYTYPVTVELEQTYFPTREYEQVTLPAGTYEALRVCIGAAEGHNWWCVVFPSLCLPATSEGFADAAETAGFPGSLNSALTGEAGYELHFYLLDAMGKLENILFQR